MELSKTKDMPLLPNGPQTKEALKSQRYCS